MRNAVLSIVAGLLGMLSASGPLQATPTLLFDGSGTPEAQGWTLLDTAGLGVPPATVTVGPDVFSVETEGGRIRTYAYATSPAAFLFSVNVAVTAASQDPFDAGFYIGVISDSLVSVSEPINHPDRANSIFVTPSSIGFTNYPAPGYPGIQTYALDATQFHTYTIYYNADHLMQIFVDQSNSDILNDAATAVLSRQFYSDRNSPGTGGNWDRYLIGSLSFGDHSNDININSSYSIDFVNYEATGPLGPRPVLASVPEPATMPLLVTGIGMLSVLSWRKRRTQISRS